MVSVNGVEMPMKNRSGLLVLEDPSGHQSWALIVDATVEYRNVDVAVDEMPEIRVVATMKPGEMLRTASTVEAGEENVLVYSRLLVEVLREERERYAELEKRHAQRGAALSAAQAENRRLVEDRDEQMRRAWRHGAAQGWFHAQPMQGQTLDEVLEMCPHPEPETETDGCHICGGPDH